METAYNRAEVCLDEGPCLPLEPGEQPSPAPDLNCVPLLVKEHLGWVRVQVGGYGMPRISSLGTDLQEIMATSRDQKELLWAWQGWRDAVGRQLRPVFEDYVRLSNKAAQYNGTWAGHIVFLGGERMPRKRTKLNLQRTQAAAESVWTMLRVHEPCNWALQTDREPALWAGS